VRDQEVQDQKHHKLVGGAKGADIDRQRVIGCVCVCVCVSRLQLLFIGWSSSPQRALHCVEPGDVETQSSLSE